MRQCTGLIESCTHITAACLTGHDGICFNQKISGYYVSLFRPWFAHVQVAQRDESFLYVSVGVKSEDQRLRLCFQGAAFTMLTPEDLFNLDSGQERSSNMSRARQRM